MGSFLLFVSTLSGSRALRMTSGSWLAVAAIGQMIFAAYIASLYGSATFTGNWARFNKVMPHGYVQNDAAGNLAVIVHVLMAAYVSLAGFLQLWPRVRQRFPKFHRWNGRIYVAFLPVISLTGIYLVWVRGTVGDLSQHLAVTLNGLLILWFALFAWRTAVARNFASHERWALRLYLVANGVWFFRVFLMCWLFVFRRPVGFDPHTFTGPTLTLISFGQTLLPLLVLELYLSARRSTNEANRWLVAALLGLFTLITAAGTFAATMGMWLPRM